MKKIIKVQLNSILVNFTFAKFSGAVITIILVAVIKYSISGNFHLNYCEFWSNVGVGLIGWTINTGVIGWLTEYLGIKGINFNLKDFLFGYDRITLGDDYLPKEFKVKLHNSMESDKESNSGKDLDKGKGIDTGAHPISDENKRKPVSQLTLGPGSAVQPHLAHWYKLHPGVDPQVFFFPKKIYFPSGFNVPGTEVPIADDICKHIDYNSHILNQFKKMDLETAIQQRNNNLKLVEAMQTKISYAQGVLAKVPTIPTTEYEFRLKNQILKDLEELNRNKVRAEARATLLNSRIQFIEINKDSNENNNF